MVPIPASVRVAPVLADGAPLADARRSKQHPARLHRSERPAIPLRLDIGRPGRREAVLHHLGNRPAAARVSLVGGRVRVRRTQHGGEHGDGDHVSACSLRRGGDLRFTGRCGIRESRLGCSRSRDDCRFLPRKQASHLGARRAQLSDRAPSLPQAPAHPLPGDRADRRAQLPAPRRALHGPAVAPSGASLSLPASSRAGACRAAGGARDGLRPG